MIRSFVLMSALILTSNLAQALPGGGDGAGGAPAVFQAKAISTILASDEVLGQFRIWGAGSEIKSIEFAGLSGKTSHYRITSNGGCVIDIDATPNDDWATSFKITSGKMTCP